MNGLPDVKFKFCYMFLRLRTAILICQVVDYVCLVNESITSLRCNSFIYFKKWGEKLANVACCYVLIVLDVSCHARNCFQLETYPLSLVDFSEVRFLFFPHSKQPSH